MKTKKFILSILSMLLGALLLATTFAGCSSDVSIYNLENAFANHIITNDDIKNIAALRNGSLQTFIRYEEGVAVLETEDFTPTKPEDQLDAKTIQKIERNLTAYLKERFKNTPLTGITVKDCAVTDYYGTYNHYMILEISFDYNGIELSEVEKDYFVNAFSIGKITEKQLVIAYYSK